jgi:hypothetical protein
MPEITGYQLGAYCCKCEPPPVVVQQTGLDIIILMENRYTLMANGVNANNNGGWDPWGSQYENGIFGLSYDPNKKKLTGKPTDNGASLNKISVPYVQVGTNLSSTYLNWVDVNLTTNPSSQMGISKAEMGSNVIFETLRKIKKSNLQLKDTLKFYFYAGEPPNGNWVSGLLSPQDHLGNKNTLSMLFWPTFKSPVNDPDPIGIKTSGDFAADSNQDYSFSAILSEGRDNNFYKNYPLYAWKTYPSGNTSNDYRPLDTDLAFVKGISMSSKDIENNPDSAFNKWSPSYKDYIKNNKYWKLITSGSYFTFNLNSGLDDPGNDEPKTDRIIDSCKIYNSQYSGYMVNVKDYFSNGNSWPTGYGNVSGPYDLFKDRSNLNIHNSIFPQLDVEQFMWDGEYLFRIPESEKNKILWRNVRITVADFADYNNSILKDNSKTPVGLCVPYERSKTGTYDEKIPLCVPNCLSDSIGCPNLTFLSSAQVEATSLNQKNGVDSVNFIDNKKGLYFNHPAVQVESTSGQGVGAVLDTLFNTSKNALGYDQVNLLTLTSAPKIHSYGFGYDQKPIIKFQNALSSNSILEENFDSVLFGKNNDISFTGWVPWTGNTNFPKVNNVFQANGTVMLSGENAYIQTDNLFLNFIDGNFGLTAGLKGWDPIEGQLKIKISGTNISNTYSFPTVNINASQFQTIYDQFNATTGKNIRFETTSGRLFLDNIRIFGPGGPPAYERGWVIRCDSTKNFDNAYAALLYMPFSSYYANRNRYGEASSTIGSAFPTFINQGLSALKNSCLHFNKNSKKMVIFMCDGFPAYSGPINDQASVSFPNSQYNLPYPSKQEIKNLLNEKEIILHSIAFNSSFLPYNYEALNNSNTFDKLYRGLSSSLKAFAPLTGDAIKDNNTKIGYVSPLEEVTLNLTGKASESKLWILNRYTFPTGAYPTGDYYNSFSILPFNWPRDTSYTYPNGTLSFVNGARIIKTAPASPLKVKQGIFYSIRKALGEIN